MTGDAISNVAKHVDTTAFKQPLGVVGGVCPFNFPAMIPLWMFPLALTCGNTVVLKPSERVPSATVILARLAAAAGYPPGVLNLVHGNKVC
jgi:malonate-semialdehyde dehydrogenase (acetylating) / methylmalonate-semialdehyde dehydrogenase